MKKKIIEYKNDKKYNQEKQNEINQQLKLEKEIKDKKKEDAKMFFKEISEKYPGPNAKRIECKQKEREDGKNSLIAMEKIMIENENKKMKLINERKEKLERDSKNLLKLYDLNKINKNKQDLENKLEEDNLAYEKK